jgi:hypothetical protein
MATVIGCMLALMLGFLGGLLVCWAYPKPATKRREHMAFAALGLLVGFLIGMSESPLVAGAVTGGFTLAGALVGKLWDQSATKTGAASGVGQTTTYRIVLFDDALAMTEAAVRQGSTSASSSSNLADEELGSKSGKRPVLNVDWLLSVSAAALIGVVLGAGIRINAVLNFRDESIPAKLRPYGFTEPQIQAMMTRFASSMPFEDIIKSDLPKGMSGLQARRIEPSSIPVEPPKESPFNWRAYWSAMKSDSPEYIVDNLLAVNNKGIVPESFRTVIASARNSGIPPKKIVEYLKSLTDH